MINMWYDKYKAEIDELSAFCALCYERGLTSAMGGNVSIRVDGGILITASNISLRKIAPEYVIMLDMDGNQIYNPYGLRPSKELHMHLGAYAARSNTHCVMHLHPPYVIALSANAESIPLVTESAKGKLGYLPVISAEAPGSDALAGSVYESIKKANASISAFALEDHGLLCLGETMEDAFNTADLAEDSAKIACIRKMAGLL